MSEPLQRTFETLAHQWKVLQSKKRFIFMGGGVGVGKTTVGSVWHSLKAAEMGPREVALIVANTYTQLIDSTMWNVYQYYEEMGIPVEPKELPKGARPFEVRIYVNGRWREIRCRSLDHHKTISGQQVAWFWADEVWQTTKEAFDILVARIRMNPNAQGLLTTTLDDPGTWMYKTFVENFDESLMDVFYAKTSENPYLGEEYVRSLKVLYDERSYRRMCMSEWVALTGQLIYYAFEAGRVVSTEAEFDPYLPILWTHDFNIGEGKPMSSALCQIKRGRFGSQARSELHVFDELILETSDTNDAVEEFDSRGYDERGIAGVRIYGDASGRAKDTRSKTSDYGILHDAGWVDQRVPKANPPIRDRHNCVNGLLKNRAGDTRIKIHPRCKTLIKGLGTVKLRKGAQYLEEETYSQHCTTALGYLCWEEFPLQRGKGSMTTGKRPW